MVLDRFVFLLPPKKTVLPANASTKEQVCPPGGLKMASENEHLDLLQNIEFVIVSTYRNHTDMSDYAVMRALDALLGWYRA